MPGIVEFRMIKDVLFCPVLVIRRYGNELLYYSAPFIEVNNSNNIKHSL